MVTKECASKSEVLWIVILTSFLYIPYDSFGFKPSITFWEIPLFLLIPIPIIFLIHRANLNLTNRVIPLVFFSIFMFWYVSTIAWSSAQNYLPTFSSLLFSFLLFLFFVYFFCRLRAVLPFLKLTMLGYSSGFLIYVFMHGLGNFRMYAGVSEINPAFVGFFSGFLFLLSGLLFFSKEKLVPNYLLLMTIGVSIITMVVTQSRMALVSILIALIASILLSSGNIFYKLRIDKNQLLKLIFATFVVLVVIFIINYLFSLYSFDLGRVASLFAKIGGATDVSGPSFDAGRSTIWLNGLANFENVFFGHGFRSFYHDNDITAHNTFLTVFYESGALGLLIFVIFIFFSFIYYCSFKTFYLFIYLILYGMGNDFLFMPVYFLCFAIFISISYRLRVTNKMSSTESEPHISG